MRVTQAAITNLYVSASHTGSLFSEWPGKGWWVTWESRLFCFYSHFFFISPFFFPPSLLPLHLSLSSSSLPFIYLLFSLNSGLVPAKHMLYYRAMSQAPRPFLTRLQSPLPLNSKRRRSENGPAIPSKPRPLVTHITSSHASLVSTCVVSQDERMATKYSL